MSPSIDPNRLLDFAATTLNVIQNFPGSMLLLCSANLDFAGFLKYNKQKNSLLLMVPKKMQEMISVLKANEKVHLVLKCVMVDHLRPFHKTFPS